MLSSMSPNVFERYFSRNSSPVVTDFPANLKVIAVIPVFDDEDIFDALHSLCRCKLSSFSAGVLIVVNYAENCREEVKQRNRELADRIEEYCRCRKDCGLFFQLIRAFEVPARLSGVGWARKLGMDAAALYFYKENQADGIIASLDADTRVEENYLRALKDFFTLHPVAGVAIAYAHRLEEVGPDNRNAMIRYELYLRYYNLALRLIGHPYAYTCLGSAFAVRAVDYAAQGGMNKRQAGEDFYFLQKLIASGRFAHLTETRVFPSARISQRTPFGTGPAVLRIIREGGKFLTYHPGAFHLLQSFFGLLDTLYRAAEEEVRCCMNRQPEPLRRFLESFDFPAMVAEVNGNIASPALFRKRFFDRFNAFQVLKYLNFVHESYFEKMEIAKAVLAFFPFFRQEGIENEYDMLLRLRKMCNEENRWTGSGYSGD